MAYSQQDFSTVPDSLKFNFGTGSHGASTYHQAKPINGSLPQTSLSRDLEPQSGAVETGNQVSDVVTLFFSLEYMR
jgi:hypothetical protein